MYDSIVIGAGHNGLVTAAYLSRAGQRVLVLERRDILGGACTTEEVWPGYRVSTAAYLCSLLHPRIIADLELPRFGFEVYRRETGGFAPFPDGSHLSLYPDAERTRAELQRFCPQDVDANFAFEADIERAAEVLEPFFFGAPPSLGSIADAFAQAGIASLFSPLFEGSVRELLDRRFRDDRLKTVLATDGLIGTNAGVSDPGTAYVLLHHYMGRALGARGLWGYVRGGMGRLSGAIAESALAHGAVIKTGAAVSQILTRNDRAIGVALENGDTYYAPKIFSNAHPVRAFDLLDTALPDDTQTRLNAWRTEGISCKINLAVSELPNFLAAPGAGVGEQHLGTVHLCPSLESLESAWDDSQAGRPSTEPMIEVYIQTATDPSLAPIGKHILSCFTQYFPYTLADGLDLETETQNYLNRALEIVSRYAPNVPASVEAAQVLTPRHLEERFGLTGGNIFHGDITPAQMFTSVGDAGSRGSSGRFGAKTEVTGLWLCGSGAFPGGCVSGIPGYNAAKMALKDEVA